MYALVTAKQDIFLEKITQNVSKAIIIVIIFVTCFLSISFVIAVIVFLCIKIYDIYIKKTNYEFVVTNLNS